MNHSVFKDLIPGYIENLTSKETNKQIEKHMEQCEDCRQYVKDMQEDLLVERTHEQKKEDKNIDFLKKVRSKNRKKIFIIVGSLLSIFIGWFFFFDQMWIADEKDIQTTVKQQGSTVTLSFQTKNDNRYLLAMPIWYQNSIDEIIIYEKWNDFSEPARILKDGSNFTFTFLDENTLILHDGEEKKLTDEDKVRIRYKNSKEEILLKDLYKLENKSK
ncbi:zf-HC2 domain-containing protein [Lysinibacillus sp. NPDC097287]|uniref:zf-HC2 domain-containing protein n=1 Tax=Lysinibacillus sp. NPDC097287 TaxID=3364144 RepID=UPI00380BC8FA